LNALLDVFYDLSRSASSEKNQGTKVWQKVPDLFGAAEFLIKLFRISDCQQRMKLQAL
jgi:hypothetical protein